MWKKNKTLKIITVSQTNNHYNFNKNRPSHFSLGIDSLPVYSSLFNIEIEKVEIGNNADNLYLKIYNSVKLFVKLFFNRHLPIYFLSGPILLIVCLRALRIYRAPIFTIKYTPGKYSKSKIIRFLIKFYYKGFDRIYLIDSKSSEMQKNFKIIDFEKIKQINWGGDLEYYDSIESPESIQPFFVSTGKEHRDFETLINAFLKTNYELYIYILDRKNIKNFDVILRRISNSNIKIIITGEFKNGEFQYEEMIKHLKNATAVVMCCEEKDYTVGYSQFVEAISVGKPIISTPFFPYNLTNVGIGIEVPYKDESRLAEAIEFIFSNPSVTSEMGKKGRQLAVEKHNIENFTKSLLEDMKIFITMN